MKIIKTKYKDIDALTVDCGDAQFTFIPESGMKVASAIDKKSGFEVMHQNPNGLDKFLRPQYGDSYGAMECAGFDDCFPSIDPYFGGADTPWADIKFPDHGEIWSLPYEINELTQDCVTATVAGVRLPYTITKKIYAKNSTTVRIEYTLKNHCDFSFKYLWAAHVMLKAQVGSKFLVPEDCTEAMCMFATHDRIGKYLDRFNYPINKDKNGVVHDMSTMRPFDPNADEKYYFTNKLSKDGFVGITYPENGLKFTLRFPIEQVPYLGILNNEGGWDGMYLCILEPCSAMYDRPDLADMHGYCSEIAGKSEISWYLDLGIDPVK